MASSLTTVQGRVLAILAGMDPPWTLTGGGALAGFHLGHRKTRDLDLFWQGAELLGDLPQEAERRLRNAGLGVTVQRSAPMFRRLAVESADGEIVLVDLVADPVPVIEAPATHPHEGTTILVDTPHEILVNKLTTLLARSELRDLVDIKALVEAGGDLDRAIRDAPNKDGGFSGPTLAWLLDQLHPGRLGAPPDVLEFREMLKRKFVS